MQESRQETIPSAVLLGLDGSARSVRGALPVALHAREEGDVGGLLVPRDSLAEARPAAAGGHGVLTRCR